MTFNIFEAAIYVKIRPNDFIAAQKLMISI